MTHDENLTLTDDEFFQMTLDTVRRIAKTHNLTAEDEDFIFYFIVTTNTAAASNIKIDSDFMWEIFWDLNGTLKKPLSKAAVDYCLFHIKNFPDFVAEMKKAEAAEVPEQKI